MATKGVMIPRGNQLDKETLDRLKKDLETNAIRPLDSDERRTYGNAVQTATTFVPAFRDAIALMRPYVDASASTAYTDRHARMGLGYWFFYLLNREQQASVILHETMHVLNNHFIRFEDYGVKSKLGNIAGDFEINTSLNRVAFVDLTDCIFPDRAPYSYPPNKTMEWYLNHMDEEEDGDDKCPECEKEKAEKGDSGDSGDSGESGESGQESSSGGEGDEAGEGSGDGEGSGQGSESDEGGSGAGGTNPENSKNCGHSSKGSPCGSANEDTEAAADEAGISRASDIEQNIAKSNTVARMREEKIRDKERGTTGHLDDLFNSVLKHLTPPKVDWRRVLRGIVASRIDSMAKGRADYSYKRASRRLQSKNFVFPGMIQYQPTVMWGIDTSGSMDVSDFQKSLNETEGLLKEVARGKSKISIFSVDTQIGNIQPVTSVRSINLSGGGGTVMAVAFQYVSNLGKKQKPDIFILSTDGYIDWADVAKEMKASEKEYYSLVLVTTPGGYAQAPAHLKASNRVIDISAEDK